MAAANHNDIVTLGVPDHCCMDRGEKGAEYKRDVTSDEQLLSVILAITSETTEAQSI